MRKTVFSVILLMMLFAVSCSDKMGGKPSGGSALSISEEQWENAFDYIINRGYTDPRGRDIKTEELSSEIGYKLVNHIQYKINGELSVIPLNMLITPDWIVQYTGDMKTVICEKEYDEFDEEWYVTSWIPGIFLIRDVEVEGETSSYFIARQSLDDNDEEEWDQNEDGKAIYTISGDEDFQYKNVSGPFNKMVELCRELKNSYSHANLSENGKFKVEVKNNKDSEIGYLVVGFNHDNMINYLEYGDTGIYSEIEYPFPVKFDVSVPDPAFSELVFPR